MLTNKMQKKQSLHIKKAISYDQKSNQWEKVISFFPTIIHATCNYLGTKNSFVLL